MDWTIALPDESTFVREQLQYQRHTTDIHGNDVILVTTKEESRVRKFHLMYNFLRTIYQSETEMPWASQIDVGGQHCVWTLTETGLDGLFCIIFFVCD